MNSNDSAAATGAAASRAYRKWTADEIEKIQRFANLGAATIATMLNRPKVAVYNKAKQLGIDVTKRRDTATVEAI